MRMFLEDCYQSRTGALEFARRSLAVCVRLINNTSHRAIGKMPAATDLPLIQGRSGGKWLQCARVFAIAGWDSRAAVRCSTWEYRGSTIYIPFGRCWRRDSYGPIV